MGQGPVRAWVNIGRGKVAPRIACLSKRPPGWPALPTVWLSPSSKIRMRSPCDVVSCGVHAGVRSPTMGVA
jgi:hypothetical protein